jgi:hypothetical protein
MSTQTAVFPEPDQLPYVQVSPVSTTVTLHLTGLTASNSVVLGAKLTDAQKDEWLESLIEAAGVARDMLHATAVQR